eukprot:jgi/Mesvir1/12174/Mv00417-RA.1
MVSDIFMSRGASLTSPLHPALAIAPTVASRGIKGQYAGCTNLSRISRRRGPLTSTVKFSNLAFSASKGKHRRIVVQSQGAPTDEEEYYIDPASLRYNSVWETKPAWCQPWSIYLTGLGIVGGSYALFHSPIVSGVVAFPISLWWYIFLFAYPRAWKRMRDVAAARLAAGGSSPRDASSPPYDGSDK